MASVYQNRYVSDCDALNEVPIRDDWVGQHLILSHGERIRIIGMPTTYLKLVESARRGFGIDRYIDLTFLVKHPLPEGTVIEAELDESAYHLLKNETQIRCVDTTHYLKMKRQDLSAPYYGWPYGATSYSSGSGSKQALQQSVAYPLGYFATIPYKPSGTVYKPTSFSTSQKLPSFSTPQKPTVPIFNTFGTELPSIVVTPPYPSANAPVDHSVAQKPTSFPVGTIWARENNKTGSSNASKATNDGATTAGQSSKQALTEEPERDPITGLPKGWILTGASSNNAQKIQKATAKSKDNQATKVCDVSSWYCNSPSSHNALAMNAQKLGDYLQDNKITKLLDTASWHDNNPLPQNVSTKAQIPTNQGTSGPATPLGQNLSASHDNGMLTVKYAPKDGSYNGRSTIFHPNLWKPVFTSGQHTSTPQEKGKGPMDHIPAEKPYNVKNTTQRPASMLATELKTLSKPESLSKPVGANVIEANGEQATHTTLASSSRGRDTVLIRSFLVATTYIWGDEDKLNKPAIDLFVAEFRRCKSLGPDDSIDNCDRDCEMLRILLSHLPTCQLRRSLDLDVDCDCGTVQDDGKQAVQSTLVEEFLKKSKKAIGSALDTADNYLGLKPSRYEINEMMVDDFHQSDCYRIGICICDVFETLLKHGSACQMRRSLDLEDRCDCGMTQNSSKEALQPTAGTTPSNQETIAECLEVAADTWSSRKLTKDEIDDVVRDFHDGGCWEAAGLSDTCDCTVLRALLDHQPKCRMRCLVDLKADCSCEQQQPSSRTSDGTHDDETSAKGDYESSQTSHRGNEKTDSDKTSTQARQSDADDASDNVGQLTPTTSKGDENSTLASDFRDDHATWAKDSLDGWDDDFEESETWEVSDKYEDMLLEHFFKNQNRRRHEKSRPAVSEDTVRFHPTRLNDVAEKPEDDALKGSPSASGQTSGEKELATEKKSVDEVSTNKSGLQIRDPWGFAGVSPSEVPTDELSFKEKLRMLQEVWDEYKPVGQKTDDDAVEEKQAGDEKESNATSPSWVFDRRWKNAVATKNWAESSSPSSFKATVEDCPDPEIPATLKAVSGGDLGFGSSSPSLCE
ncbi:hypothetical protein B0T21DRAFT_351490 [Apiosordaria backusii]|uniref:Uncharacterized protein n=1 Tax=Apiosordaria backusii TaxID=314023 RepID=A0AA40AT56_9PEZI|nr:hypothetical protein B0T21DRAFT_351490 [Apiosordaria backusii]